MRRALLATGCMALTLFFGIPLAFAPGDTPPPASASALDIPAAALAAYQRSADTCPGLRWELLAGIGKVESGHGVAGGASVGSDGVVVPAILGPPLDGKGVGGNLTPMPAGKWAGQWGLTGPWLQAVGPMQFLPPTFAAWAVDGDGDGNLDPHDIDDAVAAAASFLCGSDHQVDDERAAVRRYNASDSYVNDVLRWASTYASATPMRAVSGDAEALLRHPNVRIYQGGREDLAAGRVDQRVINVLLTLAQDHTLTVTSLITGHPRCAVNGQAHDSSCTVSKHYLGRAADIAVIDGAPVSARHPAVGPLIHQLTTLTSDLRPDEIGAPIDTGQVGVFTNSYHSDHLHIGWSQSSNEHSHALS